eukprot:CAMPEP_0201142556 /NCGR_PEP_ID=MMETSP0851-20130426/4189_1 /ASSEMBLY_ACC=CAM_ASM_000631 /TAXON_ID=183588 /ORGANISM="Pseudo-nitzschia fraudulenta, Strain WWA7" /LENGTH=514 /DNA_ID=CAMNT_0047416237 /DNA_START=139 /DNA_END=1680 /DNA_ORIENTATION=-
MSIVRVGILAIGLILCSSQIGFASNVTDCDPDEYYSSLSKTAMTREELENLLEQTHERTLPYTSSNSDDVWKALKDLDRGTDVNGSPTVRLIYSNKEVPAEPKGTSDTWNREHVWPKSLGVGYTGPDYTDVHHLFPADASVNTARSNRFFDDCNESECKPPTKLQGTKDPPLLVDDIFQPPPTARGDVARAIFYMDIRYPWLELTDCLDKDKENQMAYLSTLLAWHELDPPTEAERQRNDRVCSRWQGNRNPFVDFPDLAKAIYADSMNCKNSPTPTPPTPLTSPSRPQPGDVMVVGVHSANPDLVGLLALEDLPSGYVIYMTDNAYDGNSFASNEGIISLTLPGTVKAGTLFGYGEDLLYGSSWTSFGSFALSTSGDTVLVYSTNNNESDTNSQYTFLSAIAFAGGTFQGSGTSSSALPESIVDFSIELGNKDNYMYNRDLTTTKTSAQKDLVDEKNWMGSDSKTDVSVVSLEAKTEQFAENYQTVKSSGFWLEAGWMGIAIAILVIVASPHW